MKYKLLKDLPFTKAGETYDEDGYSEETGEKNDLFYCWIIDNLDITSLIGEWVEEVVPVVNPKPTKREELLDIIDKMKVFYNNM